jgi:CheY-like chemotaxis protein
MYGRRGHDVMQANPTSSEFAGAPTILVVEDEILLLEIITEELEEAGYQVLSAFTGEEALTYLNGPDSIDLLFTDIRLPGGMDGWRVAEAARRLRPGLPIIYVTGYSVEQPRTVSGSRFMTKPYRPSMVIQAIREFGVGA